MITLKRVFRFAVDRISDEHFPKLFDPTFHSPKHHEFGILPHIVEVAAAAATIRERTGVDAVDAALYHDLGKIQVFQQRLQGPKKLSFWNHELISARLAEGREADEATIFAVRNHDASYRVEIAFDPARFVAITENNREKLLQLTALAAADLAGRGNTPAQDEQRPKIVGLLTSVCKTYLHDLKLSTVIEEVAYGFYDGGSRGSQ